MITEEVESSSQVDLDEDEDECSSVTKSLMPDLQSVDNNLSTTQQKEMTEQFFQIFWEKYSGESIHFFIGSLDEALSKSISNVEKPRPLLLWIHHSRSIKSNIIPNRITKSRQTVDEINEKFIVWPWDRTNMTNYKQLLALVISNINPRVACEIYNMSESIDEHPLLVCLSLNSVGGIETRIIRTGVSNEELSIAMGSITNCPIAENHEIHLSEISIWCVPHSKLTKIDPSTDDTVQWEDLKIRKLKINQVQSIENFIWSIIYSREKTLMDQRIENSSCEIVLYYGCCLSEAEYILENGFINNIGHKFYLSAQHALSNRSYLNENRDSDKNYILICNVLVGNSFITPSRFDSCPNGFDSTTDGSTSYVIYSNEQILPIHIVTYNK